MALCCTSAPYTFSHTASGPITRAGCGAPPPAWRACKRSSRCGFPQCKEVQGFNKNKKSRVQVESNLRSLRVQDLKIRVQVESNVRSLRVQGLKIWVQVESNVRSLRVEGLKAGHFRKARVELAPPPPPSWFRSISPATP